MRGAPNARAFASSLPTTLPPPLSSHNTHSPSIMSAAEAEESTKDEKLKAALWYAVGQIVDSVGLSQDINASPHFIGGLSEMVWAQIDNVARDLEAFAKHSTRSTINCKDVLLLGRRNEGLDELLQAETRAVRERDG